MKATTKEINKEKMHELFEELVPMNGKAESKAGEIVRAYSRLAYRWWNDGDKIGIGYGKETCNPAARFLLKETNETIADIICKAWEVYNNGTYEGYLDELENAVLEYIEEHPELKETETKDMWDYTEDEDVDDSWDDEEEDEDEWDW